MKLKKTEEIEPALCSCTIQTLLIMKHLQTCRFKGVNEVIRCGITENIVIYFFTSLMLNRL